jgi:hypothetical protein
MTQMNGKAVKFRTLAEKRVSKTLYGIRRIGNLSGHAYEYRPEHVAQIFQALRAEVDAAENRFVQMSTPAQRSFVLE